MEYLVIDAHKNDEFVKEFDSQDNAIAYADKMWNATSDADKAKTVEYYVLKSSNPDEDADNHYDGDIIKRYK